MRKAIIVFLFVLLITKQSVCAQEQNLVDFKNPTQVYSTMQNISTKYDLNLELQNKKSREETAFILVNLLGQVEQKVITLSDNEKSQLKKLKTEYASEIEKIKGSVIAFDNDEPLMHGFVDKVKYYNSEEFKGKIFNKHLRVSVPMQLRWSTDVNRGEEKYPERFNEQLFGVVVKGEIVKDLDYNINVLFLKNFSKHTGNALGDYFITSKHIPHHEIKIGQFRTHQGIEGTISDFQMDAIDRVQTPSKLGNHRDLGLQVTGKYEYLDYIVGSYLGTGNDFSYAMNKNLDFNGWLYLKPFGSESDYGDLKVGSGIYTGNMKNMNYHILGSALEYNYKKYSLISEYLYKDGYKEANRSAHGVYVTNKYRITPKTELVATYDVFDGEKGVSNTNVTEYTLGVNYFAYGRKLKYSANYVYVNDDEADNSARITLQTQYIF